MAQALMNQMHMKAYIKEKDPEHVISWKDFLKFLSYAVQKNRKKGFQNLRL